ncbi:glycoside hydrolase family 3 C-terminal domain-containing protein [Cellulosilyticum sp. I15G10I2]|uniref:glycoside hydrolase family 3 C-terminal domain-containing protein n=1 Tax=Cellulosilyticum sp. I15G10I2 TaxID=1892843 RepID=UPI00085CD8F8|nr:glycoside hydrolase family 3 C-terminal domain-containing protein [Cellulosilyticum sp. I15G10I2]
MELVVNQDKIRLYRQRAKELVEKMNLEEKVFQTLHSAPALKHLGIEAYNWWNEALHGVARSGVATVFPQAIGLAATFDEDFIEEIADAISTEGRAKFNMQQKYKDYDIYKGLTFWAPNVNIFRDPRWGRGHETFGEDPFLSARLGVRFIKGIQGHHTDYLKAAACAKHFAVHSGPEDMRHSFNAKVTQQDLFETYLPAFKACVQEGKVEAIMGAYNRTNDEPCCGSKILIKDILRDQWGFEGHVVSDCWAIKDFHEYHKVTANAVESVALAMNNGCDLNCGNLFIYLIEAVQKGMVSESRLDEAVTNLLTTRIKLGLLDGKDASCYEGITYKQVDTKEMKTLNRRAAEKSAVLLKNAGNLLPLDKNKYKTIGIIGPNANNRKALVGNYEGTASRYVTIAEGIQDYVKEDVRIFFSEGCHLFKEKISSLGRGLDRISEVKGVCEESDLVIMCLGLDAGLEGEDGDQGNQYASGDKPDLNLPGLQELVLKTVVESGKPCILVLLSGSALAINYAQEHVPAIVQAWYPGAQGGHGIANILFGEVSPEGKLPITFYKSTEELPDFTDYNMKGRTYRYMQKEALYPFGYGLSYTDFKFTDISVSSKELTSSGIQLKGMVTNIGDYPGSEAVQVYIKALREHTPNGQLKALKKVYLQPGESQLVVFQLKLEDFALYNEEAQLIIEEGTYEISFGGSQPEKRSEALTGKKVWTTKIIAREGYYEF